MCERPICKHKKSNLKKRIFLRGCSQHFIMSNNSITKLINSNISNDETSVHKLKQLEATTSADMIQPNITSSTNISDRNMKTPPDSAQYVH